MESNTGDLIPFKTGRTIQVTEISAMFFLDEVREFCKKSIGLK